MRDKRNKSHRIAIKAYRPWDTTTLQDNIENVEEKPDTGYDTHTAKTNTTQSTLTPKGPQTENLNTAQANITEQEPKVEPNYTEESTSTKVAANFSETSIVASYENNLDRIKSNLQAELKAKTAEAKDIEDEINKPENSKLAVGGFFKTNMDSQSETGGKLNSLIQELQKKEYELQILNNNLKATEALEKAERAENAKAQEEQMRKSLQAKLNLALTESDKASEQLHHAISQLKLAKSSICKEESLRKDTEKRLASAVQDNNSMVKQLQKLESEYKNTHHNLCATNEELASLKQQHDKTNAEYRNLKRSNELVKQNLTKLNLALQQASADIKLLKQKEQQLEELKIELNKKNDEINLKTKHIQSATKEIEEKNALIPNLKNIIIQEQNLRKIAEDKLKETTNALNSSKSELEDVKKKAKVAISQASSTMMEFFNEKDTGEIAAS